MDNLTKDQRRKNMRNIRSTNTTPEKTIMSGLRKQKIYFASHVSSLAGKPDVVFRKKKIAVFIDSDFWHGHPHRFIKPKSNIKYWKEKIAGNKQRDKKVNKKLRRKGWTIIRLWEYDIKHNPQKAINKIIKSLAHKITTYTCN